MLDLTLIKNSAEKKIPVSFTIYESIHTQLERICKKENIKMSLLLRSMINNVIATYTVDHPDEITT